MTNSSSTYNDAPYLYATSNLPVPGLFRNFHTAATLLRVARSELKVTLLGNGEGNAGKRIVADFYNLLEQVETFMDRANNTELQRVIHEKFIVEVEGLDGSGKTSLVQGLADAFQASNTNSASDTASDATATATIMKTPSSSLSAIRPLWDHRGGILARAFYFITNYILEYEILNGLFGSSSTSKIIIIDRWYASTLAYTVAYQPDQEQDAPPIQDLPKHIFQWPSDLKLRPHLMLLLDINPQTRQARVDARKLMGGGASRFNPWDDRLADDPELGKRIITAMKNIHDGPQYTHIVNANGTKLEVLNASLDIVRHVYKQVKEPQLYYEHDPLIWWKNDGMQLGLCNKYGYRDSHALWNLQLAYSSSYDDKNDQNHLPSSSPPVLKTVGLYKIDSHSIYYWSSSSLLDNDHSNGVIGSVLSFAGSYPLEHQWSAEGIFTKVTKKECILFGYHPPNSLVRHIAACEDSVKRRSADNVANNSSCRRIERQEPYDEFVQKYNNGEEDECTSSSSTTINLWCFTPIRIEVLRGGPSTRIDRYPLRFEWSHNKDDEKWCMRSILPFTPSLQYIPRIEESSWTLKNCTIALMGTHTSGKTTIGNCLSELLGWSFDEELGKILRNEDELVTNGHLEGGGDGKNNKDQWDELILKKECERDVSLTAHNKCRVVETWHGGNAAWNYFRRNKGLSQNDFFRSTVFQEYLHSIRKHTESRSSVLMIFLSIDSADTIINRRLNDQDAMDRLPLEEEKEDAKHLLCLNDKAFYEYIAKAANIPLLVVDNSEHGEEAIEKTLKSILDFVREYAFRRVDIKANIEQSESIKY